MRLLLIDLASACRGVEVEGVTDPSESSDISEALERDLRRNLSSLKASDPMSLSGDSDRDSFSAIATTSTHKLSEGAETSNSNEEFKNRHQINCQINQGR